MTSIHSTTANHAVARLSTNVSRALNDGKITAGRKRIAREAFRQAFAALAMCEDDGAPMAHLEPVLTSSRQRATDLGLLTAGDVMELERAAIADADDRRARMAARRAER
jgi:hypothetical protein